jgi:hypothetical protein
MKIFQRLISVAALVAVPIDATVSPPVVIDWAE